MGLIYIVELFYSKKYLFIVSRSTFVVLFNEIDFQSGDPMYDVNCTIKL